MAHKSPFYATNATTNATKRAGRRVGSRASREARAKRIAALLAENAALRERIKDMEQELGIVEGEGM